MSTPSEIGKAITASAQLISKVGIECEHLATLIKEEVSRLLLAPEVAARYRPAGEWEDIWAQDEHEWIYTDAGASLPIKLPYKRTASFHLFFQISLAGVGVNAKNNDEPLIHIGQWLDALDFDEVQMGFPMEIDPDYVPVVVNERLFIWEEEQLAKEWCFSVRLTDINSPTDVQRNLIKPLRTLLLEGVHAKAFENTAVVKYSKVEDEHGQYEVLPK